MKITTSIGISDATIAAQKALPVTTPTNASAAATSDMIHTIRNTHFRFSLGICIAPPVKRITQRFYRIGSDVVLNNWQQEV
jgi:hypothetical protein